MRYLTLIILFFIFSCDDSPVSPSTDCEGVFGGSAFVDDCNACVSGSTGLTENYLMDECSVCNGDNSTCADCAGIPNGDAVLSGCDNACNSTAVEDCAGVCGGDSLIDNCDVCDSDSTNDCTQDCAGTWGGDAVLSGCDNICNSTAVEDCAGECGGSAAEDECGVCGGSGIPDGQCDCDGNVDDCYSVCGGPSEACDLSQNILKTSDSNEIWIGNVESNIYGFQFDIYGINITSIGDGIAQSSGLTVEIVNGENFSRILGYSTDSSFIPTACNTLLSLEYTGEITNVTNVVFGGQFGVPINIDYYDCSE